MNCLSRFGMVRGQSRTGIDSESRCLAARRLRRLLCAGSLGLCGLGAPGIAQAHIILISDGGPNTPRDFQVYSDTVGDPQKPTPCGDPSPNMPTNSVLTVQAGESVTLKWTEIIGHSGHFRIVFAPVSPAEADGGTEPEGGGAGGGVIPDPATTSYVDNDPSTQEAVTVLTHPAGTTIGTGGAVVLADDLFPHCESQDSTCDAGPVTSYPKDYSYTVTMPSTPCTNCTLQILQFMSYHTPDPSFYYHHCAAVTIVPAEGGPLAGVSDGGAGAGSSGSGSNGAGGSSGSVGTSGATGTASGSGGAGAGSSGGNNGSAGGGQASGNNGSSGGSSGPSSSGHNGGGCDIATGAASIPAAVMALSFALARRRRARKARPSDTRPST